ncbi:MAG: VWA domain-containing protein [Treponema sp.]|jgi:hypothetical protein|nr:VWA domain-containing protein [Treponema sp.]
MTKSKKIISIISIIFSISILCFAEGEAKPEEKKEKSPLTIKIDQLEYNDYPNLKAYAVIKNKKGENVTSLAPTLFSFRVDNAVVPVKAKIIPFSMANEPVDYSIMISNNGIMEGEPLDFQKNAIMKFVETMNENDTLSIYSINEEGGVIAEELKKNAFDSQLVNQIEITEAQPRLYDSINNIIKKIKQRPSQRKVMIILSDGRDQNSRFSKNELLDTLSSIGIPVYSIGITVLSSATLSNLDEMSQITNGTYYYSRRLKDIPDNIKLISDSIKQGYILNLKVKKVKADDLSHILELRVDELESEGKGTKAFIALKQPFPKWLKIFLIILGIVLIIAVIILFILYRIIKRRNMGITKRRCKICGNIMKDNWESCPFCKYLPDIKSKKKRS